MKYVIYYLLFSCVLIWLLYYTNKNTRSAVDHLLEDFNKNIIVQCIIFFLLVVLLPISITATGLKRLYMRWFNND